MTELATVDWIIVIGFLILVTIVGFALSRAASGGLEDYFLGGNKIPWWVLGISTSTSNFDMSGTMIIVAAVFSLGYKGFLVEIRGGVGLSLAFLMIFLAKWLRRSRVMTSAEWMKLRFGTDKQGRAAHLLSAIANIVLSLGMIIYFCTGAGKFLTYFLPFSAFTCTTVMVVIGLFYTLMSGLYGVVFTDVVQMILLSFTAIYITVIAFGLTPDVTIPEGFLSLNLENPSGPGVANLAGQAGWEPILEMFGLVICIYLMRTFLEGSGGVGGYTDQRFFAARNEREASLLTLEAIVLSILRWTMVAGLVIMGMHLLQKGAPGAEAIANDPESVLPVVLSELLPAGIKGVVLAGLIAAAMSTFDSTLNAGASYIVKDVYESYIKPDASGEDLMKVSRYATIGLCVAGVALSAIIPNINAIWGLITTALGPALFIPLFLRWYWPRFNGYGFAFGTGGGIIAALIVDLALGMPLHTGFPTIVVISLVTCVGASLATPPTEDAVLVRFYTQVNPWGFWKPVIDKAVDAGELTWKEAADQLWEKINDGIALCMAVPFQMFMLLFGMALVFHDWPKVGFFAIAGSLCGIGLYFFWFKGLKSTEQCTAEDVAHLARWGEGFSTVSNRTAGGGPATAASAGDAGKGEKGDEEA